MEESERVLKMKSRIVALVTEETDIDLLHIILAELTEAKLARAAAE